MHTRIFGALVALLLGVSVASAQITVPNTLAAGAVIRAAELNTNFSTIADKALNRITGGSIEGNVTLLTNVTFDGVDLSDFLLTTGEIRANALGTVTVPAFSASTDTNTGIYFPAADELAVTLGGTQRWLLNASGLTVFGVNIINGSGQIPALSSTYFTSLNGSALTALNATELTTGTVADARLSANVPLLDAATNAFTGNASFGGTLGVTGTSTLAAVSATAATVTSFTMATGAVNGYILTTDGSGVGTWQSAGVATGAVPSGLIAIFDTSCPATWTRFTAFDNKFIRGGATYAAVGGGADSHTHTVDPAAVTSAAGGSHAHTVDPASTGSSSAGSHDHGAATGAGGAHSHLSSGGTLTAGGHSHTGTTDNGGDHTHNVNTTNSALEGGTASGQVPTDTTSGGSHNHTFSTSSVSDHEHNISNLPSDTSSTHTHSITSAASHAHDVDIASTASSTAADHTHSVDVASTASGSGANVPAYSQVVFCKKD